MLNRFHEKSQKVIALSESIAFELSNSSVGSEHLLLALLKNNSYKIKALLEKEKITYEVIKDEIINLFGKKDNKPFYMEYTTTFKKIIENALMISKKKGEDKVSVDALSIALLENEDSMAYELIKKHTNKIPYFIDELRKNLRKSSELDNVLEISNLNVKAMKNEPVLIHRENEINILIETLLRKQKQNAVIIGDPGVGKTALVEYLAYLIVKQQVPTFLKEKTIYELDISSIIAGTKYRGEFEEKLKKILKKVKEDKNAILFIDEIHNIIGAGGAEGAIDASSIIKPYLSKGEICCIGATTYDEYVKIFEKEKALERRFTLVRLKEPSKNETLDILKALKSGFIKYHNINIDDKILENVVDLCANYVFERHFPDKAIDVLDMSCVRAKSKNLAEVDLESIIEIIEHNYNVKIKLTNKADELQNSLNNILLGQEKAIKKICDHIRYIETGLNDINRPLGVFLFVGATGVGKTESAKQIAYNYFGNENKFIKLDMSEYNEPACVNKLLGSPPGYVGFERQSLLVDHIRNNPHSVVVLDEVEKAHRDILDIFLNVFDEGYFYDSSKRKIDFTNSIIIMTSNLGFSEEIFHKCKIGYINNKIDNKDINIIINKHFRPEFINRIDDIIYFDNLNKEACEILANRYIDEYQKKINYKLSRKEIIDETINDNESMRFGARGIKRKVKKEILLQIEKIKV